MVKVGYYGSFNYDKELIVDDIGNCAIEAIDIYDQFYYFVVKSELGMMSVFQYGPVSPDIKEPPKTVEASYTRRNYSKQKLLMELSKFLGKKPPVIGNKSNYIINAYEVDVQDVYNKCPNIVDIIKDWTYNKDEKIFDEMMEDYD